MAIPPWKKGVPSNGKISIPVEKNAIIDHPPRIGLYDPIQLLMKIYVLNVSPWISSWISHKNQLPMVKKKPVTSCHINHQAVWGSASRAPRFAANRPTTKSLMDCYAKSPFFSVKHHLLSSNFIWAMVSNSQTVHQNMSEPEAIERWLAFPLNLIILSRTCC